MPNEKLINTAALAEVLLRNSPQDRLVVVDVRTAEHYAAGHLPGARRLEYASIIRADPPIGGLLPEAQMFNQIIRSLGIATDSWVVAYDGEGGAAASRLLWTLNAFGFDRTTLLNGGINAWIADGNTVETETPFIPRTDITLAVSGAAVIDSATLQRKLSDSNLALLDARTIDEYTGAKVRANHGGRIPGAQHFEWTDALDKTSHLRLLPDQILQAMLDKRGITRDKDVVVYCQTHHRSALSYQMLKHLGYKSVSALDGAWSNWGNQDETPKETG